MSLDRQHRTRLSALKISVGYLLVSAAWIFFSDRALNLLPAAVTNQYPWIDTAKGLAFVVATALLLYWLVQRQHRALVKVNQALEELVRQRTRELELLNKELTASNEEFVATNEELTINNEQLLTATETIQQQADVILRQKDEQLNRVLDNSRDAIFSIDLTGHGHHYVSNSTRHLLGNPTETQLADAAYWMERTHPDDQAIRSMGEHVLRTTGQAEFVTRCRMADGSYRWLRERYRLELRDGHAVRREGMASDVTSLKEAEQKLAEERTILRSVIDNIPDYIYVKDLNRNHIINNKSNVALLGGHTEAETLGKSAPDYFGEQGLAFEADDRAVIAEGRALVNKEETISAADGSLRILLTTKVPLRTATGEIAGLVGISRDITALRQQEETLRRYRENLDILFHNTVEEILLLDHEGRVVLYNRAFEEFTTKVRGRMPQLGQYLWDVTAPERADIARSLFQRALQGEHMVIDAPIALEGRPVVHELHYHPVAIDGQVRYVSITSMDVTERKQREQQILALRDSLSDFQQAIYRSSIVSRADVKGVITMVNQNFVKISGYSEQELVGNTHQIINSGHHPRSFWVGMWQTITRGKIWRGEVKNRAKDGRYYWVDTFIMPFVDEKGQVREFLSIRNDITDRKLAEEKLAHSRRLLDTANEVAKIGYWDYELATARLTWNERTLKLLGLPPTFEGGVTDYLTRVHPEDLEQVKVALFNALRAAEPFGLDHRIVAPDGGLRWVHQEAIVIRDEQGRPARLLGILQDITERKGTEQVLREYIEKHQILSRATNDAIWDWDVPQDQEVWNHGLKTIFGYEQVVIHQPMQWRQDKIHPTESYQVLTSLREAIEAHQTHWSATYRYRCANGTYKHVLDRAYILYRQGAVTRIIGAMQDISDLKQSLAEIEKLSLVASKISNAVIITDPLDCIEWVNQAFTDLTGYSLEEVKGKKPGHFLQGPDTDPETVRRVSQKIKMRQPVSEEIVNYSKMGRRYWLSLNITPVFNERHELQHFIAIQTDISKQKEFEERITAIARELTNLIETANVPIFGIDRNGYINEWNRVAAELTGYTKNEVWEKKWTELLQPGQQREVMRALSKVLLGHPVSNYELPFRIRNGRVLVFLLAASPRRDTRNEITGAIFVAQDLTELIRYRKGLEDLVEGRTRELKLALAKEKELVDMKSKFVSIASHEFRTPLTTISIASGFIRKYYHRLQPPDIEKKLDSIDKQVHHMTYLLDDVLMIGKAEAGKLTVQRSFVAVRDLVKQLVEEVQASSNTHHIAIRWNTPITELYTDAKLMRNILINLLTNAIKFSPDADTVELVLSGDRHALVVGVRDHGIGIPANDLDKIFQSFQRGSNVGPIEGTGLGLSIVKKAVDLLGGRISVTSRENQGTEFTVHLPHV